eukprot:COSAG02_NODE_3098_length_7378_cov_4.737189_4_plen_72_part_00
MGPVFQGGLSLHIDEHMVQNCSKLLSSIVVQLTRDGLGSEGWDGNWICFRTAPIDKILLQLSSILQQLVFC